MIAAQTLPRLLAYEQESDCRHELVDGYLYAMTGASDRHEEIAANLLALIHAHLVGSGCRVYGANLKIRVGDDFFYPDLFVRCAKERGDPYFKTDPVLVVEVLSPNTQRYDRGDKWLAYQRLESTWEAVKRRALTPEQREREIAVFIDVAHNERIAQGVAPNCERAPAQTAKP
jgi:Uma2 family endonuclease